MTERFEIAGYCRISVDDELDKDNTSIENQKSIIEDYVKRTFPGSLSRSGMSSSIGAVKG